MLAEVLERPPTNDVRQCHCAFGKVRFLVRGFLFRHKNFFYLNDFDRVPLGRTRKFLCPLDKPPRRLDFFCFDVFRFSENHQKVISRDCCSEGMLRLGTYNLSRVWLRYRSSKVNFLVLFLVLFSSENPGRLLPGVRASLTFVR